MKALRIFFKILLFPVSLLLTIFVAVSMFLVGRVAAIFNIFSEVMFLGALAIRTAALGDVACGQAG